MNLALAEAEVVAKCEKAGVAISTIETLADGSTRLVCTTGDGAEQMRRLFKKSVVVGFERRFAFTDGPPPLE
jgi:hypothetical protein